MERKFKDRYGDAITISSDKGEILLESEDSFLVFEPSTSLGLGLELVRASLGISPEEEDSLRLKLGMPTLEARRRKLEQDYWALRGVRPGKADSPYIKRVCTICCWTFTTNLPTQVNCARCSQEEEHEHNA